MKQTYMQLFHYVPNLFLSKNKNKIENKKNNILDHFL